MFTSVTIIAVGSLLILTLLSNGILQYRKAQDASQKQECEKYSAIINTTQELIRLAGYLPYRSPSIQLCLHKRLKSAAKSILYIDSDNAKAKEVAFLAEQGIRSHSSIDTDPTTDERNWRLPGTEKQSVAYLRLIKRLRTTLKTEFSKGNMSHNEYLSELKRLDRLQMKLNIRNLKGRIDQAIARDDLTTALQIIEKGIQYLSGREGPAEELKSLTDQREKLTKQASEMLQSLQTETIRTRDQERQMEIQQLFDQDKRKVHW